MHVAGVRDGTENAMNTLGFVGHLSQQPGGRALYGMQTGTSATTDIGNDDLDSGKFCHV